VQRLRCNQRKRMFSGGYCRSGSIAQGLKWVPGERRTAGQISWAAHACVDHLQEKKHIRGEERDKSRARGTGDGSVGAGGRKQGHLSSLTETGAN